MSVAKLPVTESAQPVTTQPVTTQMVSAERILYSRYEHGSVPVCVRTMSAGGTIYQVLPTGKTYTSARQLLIDLTGHPEARHWTFDRYFRQGAFSPSGLTVTATGLSPIMSLFGTEPLSALSPSALTVSPARPRPVTNRGAGGKGIDLGKRGHEVAKLLFAGFGHQIYANGYDPDDVLQEVYKGILIRNLGKCPFDPAKSSFGHYVHMVAGCVLSNYHRKMNRQRAVEVIGIKAKDDDAEYGMQDVAEACSRMSFAGGAGSHAQSHDDLLLKDFVTHLRQAPSSAENQTALKILPLVLDGYERGEIAQNLELSKATISRALTYLRQAVGNWNLSPFLA